ncbi:hypothetical protein QYE76_006153 [Lolium multiflorum]|uniref:Uncharacterized protein n=1 Tax=Lolium multiflorum TaxID=4521 RepID=A0AAD8RVB7_LOLMU|nr:hypothetical protein QYE76_006153 [Lolium multiflorum]
MGYQAGHVLSCAAAECVRISLGHCSLLEANIRLNFPSHVGSRHADMGEGAHGTRCRCQVVQAIPWIGRRCFDAMRWHCLLMRRAANIFVTYSNTPWLDWSSPACKCGKAIAHFIYGDLGTELTCAKPNGFLHLVTSLMDLYTHGKNRCYSTNNISVDTFTPATERGLPVTKTVSRIPLQDILARVVGDVPIMSNHHVVDFTDAGNKVNEQVHGDHLMDILIALEMDIIDHIHKASNPPTRK